MGIKIRGICRILAILLLIAVFVACGGKTAESTKTDTGSVAESGAGAAAENAQRGDSAFEITDTRIYDKNDVTVDVKEVSLQDSYFYMTFDIRNNQKREVNVSISPLIVNDALVFNEGMFATAESGQTVEGYVLFSVERLAPAGISFVQKLQGYLTLMADYDPITEPELLTLIPGKSDAGPDLIEHSSEIIYDAQGVIISYLGLHSDSYLGNSPVFLVSNDSNETVYLDTPFREEKIDGTPSANRMLMLTGGKTLPQYKELVYASVFDSETYESEKFTSLDFELIVCFDNERWLQEQIPIHLKAEGNTYAFSAEKAYYPDAVLERMEYEEKEAERRAQEEARKANAETIREPVVEEIGIYNYSIGSSYNRSSITAMVRNPNERTYLYDIRIECEAYGKDGALLTTAKTDYGSKITVGPGEALPFEMSGRTDLGVDVAEVKITQIRYKSFNEVDLETEKNEHGLALVNPNLHLDDCNVQEGDTSNKLHMYWKEASVTGTLVNDAEAAKRVYILIVLYNAKGEIILSATESENDLASGEARQFKRSFSTGMYELPDYDHAAVYLMK